MVVGAVRGAESVSVRASNESERARNKHAILARFWLLVDLLRQHSSIGAFYRHWRDPDELH